MSPKISEPEALACGRIPTLNQRGFTTDFLDPLSERFSEYAAEIDSEVLDIGCAYGVAVKRVLAAGGRVCACDMDERHLDVLSNAVDPVGKLRLRCVAGILPHVDFEKCSFGAILCSRVLHFLEGGDVQLSVSKMHRWLRPGGKVFLIVDTPYSGASAYKVIPEYERKKALNDPWPGFMPDFEKYMPADSNVKFDTSFIHLMDPDTLARVCEQAGFTVENKGFMARIANLSRADAMRRDHATVVAVKT
jgi:SAM-dependent methyltransferase